MKVEDYPNNGWLKYIQITIDVNAQDSLKSLTLTFDDKSSYDDTKALLFLNGTFKGSKIVHSVKLININKEIHKIYSVRFVFTPFVFGTNNMNIKALVLKQLSLPKREITQRTINQQKFELSYDYSFEFVQPPLLNFNIYQKGQNGRLVIQFPGIPIFANVSYGNVIDIFKDADQDGLLDSWENYVLEEFCPFLKFNVDEDLLKNSNHHVLIFSRVTPYQDNVGTTDKYIVIRSVVAFSKDYGDPKAHIESHNGDTQEYITFWKITGIDKIELEKIQSVRHTKFLFSNVPPHPDAIMSQFTVEQQELGLGHPILYPEEDKHGIWPNADMCFDQSAYDCYQSRQAGVVALLKPLIFNVGEPQKEGELGMPFMNCFDNITAHGPHKAAFNIFKGECIWSPNQFFGGLGDDGKGSTSIGLLLSKSEEPVFLTDGSRQNPVLINVKMSDVDPALITFR